MRTTAALGTPRRCIVSQLVGLLYCNRLDCNQGFLILVVSNSFSACSHSSQIGLWHSLKYASLVGIVNWSERFK